MLCPKNPKWIFVEIFANTILIEFFFHIKSSVSCQRGEWCDKLVYLQGLAANSIQTQIYNDVLKNCESNILLVWVVNVSKYEVNYIFNKQKNYFYNFFLLNSEGHNVDIYLLYPLRCCLYLHYWPLISVIHWSWWTWPWYNVRTAKSFVVQIVPFYLSFMHHICICMYQ